MYLPDTYGTANSGDWAQHFKDYARILLELLLQLFAWFSNNVFGPLLYWLQNVLAQLPDWTIKVFSTLGELVHIYKYWAHLIAWSIFFGPIVLLIPFLLLHEILIISTFYLTYTLHGLIHRSLPDQYETLRLSFLDAREFLFSFVDRSSNVFNRWTANHMPLMVLRLAGGALGGILFFVIWTGW